jgi:hypothetical protein
MSSLEVPSSFQVVTELGEPTQVYRRRGQTKGCGLAVSIVLLFVAVGTGFCSFSVLADGISGSQGLEMLPYVGLPTLLVVVGAVFFVWWTLARWREAAVVYGDGLAYFNGRKMHVIEWNEVAWLASNVVRHYLYGVIPAGTDHIYTIATQSGDRFRLGNSLSDIGELGKRIRKEVFPYALARAQETFDSGWPVDFGLLSISKAQGVQKGNKVYPWSDIAEITVSSGWVRGRLRTDRQMASIYAPVSRVPNVDVFLTISTGMLG